MRDHDFTVGTSDLSKTMIGSKARCYRTAGIKEAHRNFLMYRDMAVLSLLFIALAPLFLYLAGTSPGAQWFGAALFTAQYLMTFVSGRNNGIRFVTNVLAVHSARRVGAPAALAS